VEDQGEVVLRRTDTEDWSKHECGKKGSFRKL